MVVHTIPRHNFEIARFADPSKVGTLRYNFLLQSLADLDTSLQKLGA